MARRAALWNLKGWFQVSSDCTHKASMVSSLLYSLLLSSGRRAVLLH